MTEPTLNRCRLVLIAPDTGADAFAPRLREALAGGDVASVIIPAYGRDEQGLQAFAEAVVPIVQEAGAAAVIAGDTRIAGRVKADGLHVEGGVAALAEAVGKFQAKLAVGTGGVKTRDEALDLGELRPDYMFFGRFGYDNRPEPHPRNLNLARWWAEMIETPCIVLGGSAVASAEAVAETGAEFVALCAAVFGEGAQPGAAVAEVNALLDRAASRFED